MFLYILLDILLSRLYSLFFPPRKIGDVLGVVYYFNGRRRQVFIPLRLEPDQTAYLDRNGIRVDITQQGGVPYIVSAKDFGGDKIVVQGMEREFVFRGDDVPALD